jgi:hypothetical protein
VAARVGGGRVRVGYVARRVLVVLQTKDTTTKEQLTNSGCWHLNVVYAWVSSVRIFGRGILGRSRLWCPATRHGSQRRNVVIDAWTCASSFAVM